MKFLDLIGTMKTANAVVAKISSKGIAVSPNTSCDKTPGCGSCTACGPPAESKHMFFAPVSNPSDYALGQCVTATYFAINEALAAFIVFGLPLCCALAAFAGYSLYFSAGAESPGAILAAVSALFGGFLLIYGIERITHMLFPVTVETNNTQS